MNKTMNKTIGIIGAMAITACVGYLYGTVQKVTLEGFLDTKSEEFYMNYLDIRTVTAYSGSDEGLQLYTEDGNGYYIEAENIGKHDTQEIMTEVHHIDSDSGYDNLWNALEARNGKIIIEVSNGTVTSENGDGVDMCGYYRYYNTDRFSVGDKVQSVFVYSCENNYIDDVICRVDTLIE